MFKGLLSPGTPGRAARRLLTLSNATRRGGRLYKQESPPQHGSRRDAQSNDYAAWSAAQAETLAQEDATRQARDPRRRWDTASGDNAEGRTDAPRQHARRGGARAPATTPHYDAVNQDTGNSAVQERFDALVHRALLRYGPPLPVDVAVSCKVITAFSEAATPNARRGAQHSHTTSGTAHDAGADDPSAVYYDEVGIKLHELLVILRKEEPHFSLRDDCGGVPLALMVKNCSFLRAFQGKVNYMRFVRRPRCGEGAAGLAADGRNVALLSLGKYKMRELPSQDGIRQGPQQWRYSYRML